MTKYFFIPFVYELLIAGAIEAWQSDKSWVVITGVYKQGNFISGISQVYGIDHNQQQHSIPKSGVNFEGKTNCIIGFCLKGNVQELAPNAYEVLMSLEGVQEFTNPQEYLDYIEMLY